MYQLYPHPKTKYGDSIIFDRPNLKADDTVYSDRLFQWEPDKFNELCKKYWGNTRQGFHGRKADEIEKFLCDYFGKTIIITQIITGLNKSNGYPYWGFSFTYKSS